MIAARLTLPRIPVPWIPRLRIPRLRVPLPRALWARLSLLMLVATAPMLAVLVLSAMADGRRVVEAARDQVVQLARLAAEQQDDTLQEATHLLHVLAKVGTVRDLRSGSCDDLLASVAADHPRIEAIAAARPDGAVVCASRPGIVGLNASDRPYFSEAMQSPGGTAVLSSLTVSRVSGRPTMFVAVPIPSGQPWAASGSQPWATASGQPSRASDGQTSAAPGGVGADGRAGVPGVAGVPARPKAGVLVASLNLAWFSRLGDRLPGGGDKLVMVLDSADGAVLTRQPDLTAGIGALVPGHPVLQAARATPAGGSLVADDLEGVSRVFGYAPLPGRDRIVIAVGLRESEVRAAADWRSGLALAVALGAAAFAMGAGAIVARRALLRPVRSLVRAAQLVGDGNLAAYAPMERGAAQELRTLASSFARMGRRLRQRDERIAAMGRQLAVSETHHRLLANTVTDVIAQFDPQFRYVYVSPSCREVLGQAPETLAGRRLSEFVMREDWAEVDTALLLPLMNGRPAVSVTYRTVRADGQPSWVESNGRSLADGTGYVLVSRDVSARVALEAKLEEANRQLRILVRQDGLTRLGNRRHFDDMLGREYGRALRMRTPLALILLDVDRFKAFNDRYGHPAGDACLQAVAGLLGAALRRPADLAARYGGEEFAMLLPSTDEAGALATAARIREAVQAAALPHAGSEFGMVSLSLGVAVLPAGAAGDGPAALVEAADAALYQAKRAGRNTVQLAAGPSVAAPHEAGTQRPDDPVRRPG